MGMATERQEALLKRTEVYDAEEVQYHKNMFRFDFLFLPFFAAWYFFLALCVQPDALKTVSPALSAPGWVVALQGVLAALAMLIWLADVTMPGPKKSEDFYQVLKVCGWYITLTRHCLTFQMIHLTASFVGTIADIQWLLTVTSGITLFVGSAGWFVTIQYYSLVHFNEAFAGRCDRMIEMGFVHYRNMNIFTHSPALLLSVLDIVLAKNRGTLEEHCSVIANFVLCSFYVVFYVVLVRLNKKLTGAFPYAFLDDLHTSKDWAKFMAVQMATFWFFCSIESILGLLPAAW